jgi:hypothetical protein
MTSYTKFCLIGGIITLSVIGCKKKSGSDTEPQNNLPQVTTAPVTNITTTTATSGGTSTSNSGGAITASGICYSKSNATPGLTDDTTNVVTTASGDFISNLKNLIPGTTYYVRAYAINSVGTAYGKVVTFTTTNGAPNVAPIAIDITIEGNVRVAEPIVARYTYFDLDHDPEAKTSFKWYIASDTLGAPITAINGATDSTYTMQAGDLGKYIKAGITPKAASGVSPGQEFRSYWVRVAKQLPTITFTYNGQPVTYGIVTSTRTGRQWLDRNLGAPNMPRQYDDWRNMGDLFQWGRRADGHQLIKRAATTAATTPVNGTTTTTLSTTDDPGNAFFITPVKAPFDWRDPQNSNLWIPTGGTNNVCPAGWHVPTLAEWEAEQLTSMESAFNRLLITIGGLRESDGAIHSTNVAGIYWTSSLEPDNTTNFTRARTYFFASTLAPLAGRDAQASGHSVRCIKD